MNKESILLEIQSLIGEFEQLIYDKQPHSLLRDKFTDIQYLFSKTFSLIDRITGIDKYYLNETKDCIQVSKRNGGIAVQNIMQLIGQLKFIKDGLENNWITKLQYEIEGNEMLEFLNHSVNYTIKGIKIQSSVISSAIFEDTIRKIGKRHSIENKNLEQILNSLKSNNIFTSVFAGKLGYYSKVRNKALHASWDEFTLEDIQQLNSDLESLIREHIIAK
jgi:hypothetical protein